MKWGMNLHITQPCMYMYKGTCSPAELCHLTQPVKTVKIIPIWLVHFPI